MLYTFTKYLIQAKTFSLNKTAEIITIVNQKAMDKVVKNSKNQNITEIILPKPIAIINLNEIQLKLSEKNPILADDLPEKIIKRNEFSSVSDLNDLVKKYHKKCITDALHVKASQIIRIGFGHAKETLNAKTIGILDFDMIRSNFPNPTPEKKEIRVLCIHMKTNNFIHNQNGYFTQEITRIWNLSHPDVPQFCDVQTRRILPQKKSEMLGSAAIMLDMTEKCILETVCQNNSHLYLKDYTIISKH